MKEKRQKQQQQQQQQQRQQNKQRHEGARENGCYSEKVIAKRFCWALKLGLLQLICKVSLIFKSSLELALKLILKRRELHESKNVAVEL